MSPPTSRGCPRAHLRNARGSSRRRCGPPRFPGLRRCESNRRRCGGRDRPGRRAPARARLGVGRDVALDVFDVDGTAPGHEVDAAATLVDLDGAALATRLEDALEVLELDPPMPGARFDVARGILDGDGATAGLDLDRVVGGHRHLEAHAPPGPGRQPVDDGDVAGFDVDVATLLAHLEIGEREGATPGDEHFDLVAVVGLDVDRADAGVEHQAPALAHVELTLGPLGLGVAPHQEEGEGAAHPEAVLDPAAAPRPFRGRGPGLRRSQVGEHGQRE